MSEQKQKASEVSTTSVIGMNWSYHVHVTYHDRVIRQVSTNFRVRVDSSSLGCFFLFLSPGTPANVKGHMETAWTNRSHGS